MAPKASSAARDAQSAEEMTLDELLGYATVINMGYQLKDDNGLASLPLTCFGLE